MLTIIRTTVYRSVVSNTANFVKTERPHSFKGGLYWIEFLTHYHWQ